MSENSTKKLVVKTIVRVSDFSASEYVLVTKTREARGEGVAKAATVEV